MSRLPVFLLLMVGLAGTAGSQPFRNEGLFISKDDGSPSREPTMHILVGYHNPLTGKEPGTILSLTSNNGWVVQGDFYYGNYAVIPGDAGLVILTSVQVRGKDTLNFTDTFLAYRPPTPKIRLDDSRLKEDSLLIIALVDSVTGESLPPNFVIGRMYVPMYYDSTHLNGVGICECFEDTIDLRERCHRDFRYTNGGLIRIRILVRDLDTDVLIDSCRFEYILDQ